MQNNKNGGAAQPTGSSTQAIVSDLGDLRTFKPSFAWRLTNFIGLQRGTPALYAAKFVGKTFGAATLRAKLFGNLYRPDFASMPPDMALKLKVMLQARVDLDPVRLKRLYAELVDWPIDVRELARYFGGDLTQYGLLSTRLVTDNGVGYIVDAFQNLTELENMKYHGYGTGTTAEAQGDSALVTELTTEYVSNSTRPTGTTTEGASANIYRTVATLSPDSGGTLAITEHGVFSASSAGVLLDRSKFSAINLVANADSLQTTYELTVSAGG